MNLVIVESPSKAKTIKKYLGKDYVVKASKGHVADLPKSKIGIDVEKNFKPTYVVTNQKTLSELKQEFAKADKLILAVDLDREGEAIAWHIAQRLGAIGGKGVKKSTKPVKRIVFSEITKAAIEDAIKHPREINMDLVNAQQARRFVDRLVGYKLSPVLWKKISFGLSAGRVQSVALRLVVEREEERDAFNPEEYWSVISFASKDKKNVPSINIIEKADIKEDNLPEEENKELIKFDLVKYKSKKFEESKRKNVESLLKDLEKHTLEVTSVEKKITKRYPKPPFTTSTLQQTAVNTLGFTSKRTMMVAQKLYEAGFITYMRTDSVTMSKEAVSQARSLIKSKYGQKYMPAEAIFYKTKSKASQEAHECVRPVDFRVDNDSKFTPDEARLYKLIHSRALGSQMTPAEIENIAIISQKGDFEFRSNGNRVVFEGFLKINQEKIKENFLPVINKGDIYYSKTINAEQHFTQPPARYSEASLIKKLEELGIGRPSTYSSIISTIISRRYVEKENKYLFPTDTGKVVNKLLVKYFNNIVDYGFTSQMENNLDDIAEGKLDWIKMLKDFYFPFQAEVEKNEKNIPRDEFTVLGNAPDDIKCPICGSPMQIKLGRFGKFYSCSKFPECKGILSIDGISEEDLQKETLNEEFTSSYEPSPKTEDGRNFLLKKGKFGKFWAHPDYPKVKDARPLELKPEKVKELYGEPPKADDKQSYILRQGKFGPFWAHPKYPEVKDIIRIKKG